MSIVNKFLPADPGVVKHRDEVRRQIYVALSCTPEACRPRVMADMIWGVSGAMKILLGERHARAAIELELLDVGLNRSPPPTPAPHTHALGWYVSGFAAGLILGVAMAQAVRI